MILRILLLATIAQRCWLFPTETEQKESVSSKISSTTAKPEDLTEKSAKAIVLPPEVVISSEPMNVKKTEQSPVTYVKIDDDGIPVIEGVRVHDEDDGLIYRNAKVINGKLYQGRLPSLKTSSKKQARILSLSSKSLNSRQDPSNYIPQYVDTPTSHQIPSSFPYYSGNPSSASLLNVGGQFQSPAQDPFGEYNQGFSGPGFSDQGFPSQGFSAQNFGSLGGQSGFPEGNYFPLEEFPDNDEDDENRNVFQRIMDTFRRGHYRMRDFVSPVIDPIFEMGQRLTDTLGITNSLEKAFVLPDGVTRQDVAVPAVVGGSVGLAALGIASVLGLLNSGGLLNTPTVLANGTSLFPSFGPANITAVIGNLVGSSGGVSGIGKRSVDDEEGILDAIGGSQLSLLGRLHSAWRSSPCAKRLLCHLMAMTPDDVLYSIEQRVLNMMFRMGIDKKHYAALRDEMDIALQSGSCDIVRCTEEDVSVNAILNPVRLANTRRSPGPKKYLVPPKFGA